MSYAENTKVDVGKSRDEIERMLSKRGSTTFLAGVRNGRIFVAFELDNLHIRFEIEAPVKDEYLKTESGKPRTEASFESAFEQAQKQKWRAMFLSIKAKLISIEEGIETFEQAFLAHIVTNDGTTVGEKLIPRLQEALKGVEIKLLTE